MRRLPKVDQLVAQVTEQVEAAQSAELHKQASAPAPEYVVPLAGELKTAAENCRAQAASVTVGDVTRFAQRLMR